MCEQCEQTPNPDREAFIERTWDEIRALANGTSEDAKDATPDQVAAMIAMRCAIINKHLPSGNFFGAPCSLILGAWAGVALEAEMMTDARMEAMLNEVISNIAQNN